MIVYRWRQRLPHTFWVFILSSTLIFAASFLGTQESTVSAFAKSIYFYFSGLFELITISLLIKNFRRTCHYSAKINGSLKSFHAFFVARVSRLYPLFFATFCRIDLVYF